MKVENLKANPENPRTITQAKLSQLKKSMLEYGDLSGIVFNTQTGRVTGGTQRTKNLDPKAEVFITKTFEIPTRTGTTALGYVLQDGERFSYREVNWDKHKEMAANIAANKGAGSWDDVQLGEWMKELASFDVDYDMELTMFDDEELVKLGIKEESRVGVTGVDEDAVPDVKKTNIQLGDLFQLGNHRLLCGDSTIKENVETLMAGEKADMVFTDPPYGIDYQDCSNVTSISNLKGKTYRRIEGDDVAFNPSHIFELFGYCKEMFLWGGDYYIDKEMIRAGSLLVWDKRMGDQDSLPGSHFEICWSKEKHQRRILRIPWVGVFATERGETRTHPTQKSIKMIEGMLGRWGKETKLVWDGYLGSGSTLIACEKTNRKCYGMEIDPQYCRVIIDRWEKYTGQKAKLLNPKSRSILKKKTVAASINRHA